jgi:hypothetical protein
MEVKKFNALEKSGKDKIYQRGGKKISQRIIDSYNEQGYKLYYYDKDKFDLVEIERLKLSTDKANAKARSIKSSDYLDEWSIWGEEIFFLNDEEYNKAMNIINKVKDITEKYYKQIENVSKLPMSTIMYEIIKI